MTTPRSEELFLKEITAFSNLALTILQEEYGTFRRMAEKANVSTATIFRLWYYGPSLRTHALTLTKVGDAAGMAMEWIKGRALLKMRKAG